MVFYEDLSYRQHHLFLLKTSNETRITKHKTWSWELYASKPHFMQLVTSPSQHRTASVPAVQSFSCMATFGTAEKVNLHLCVGFAEARMTLMGETWGRVLMLRSVHSLGCIGSHKIANTISGWFWEKNKCSFLSLRRWLNSDVPIRMHAQRYQNNTHIIATFLWQIEFGRYCRQLMWTRIRCSVDTNWVRTATSMVQLNSRGSVWSDYTTWAAEWRTCNSKKFTMFEWRNDNVCQNKSAIKSKEGCN